MERALINPSRYLIVVVSVSAYASSLLMPAFLCRSNSMLGFQVLLMGWIAVIGLQPAWFANILYFIMTYRLVRGTNTRNLLLPGAASFLAIAGLAGGPGCGPDIANISLGLSAGGYLWIGAILVVSAYYAAKRPAPAC
ncbi:hypothetical protein SAMN05518865_12055 [Duganella sp. CF458]|uniref:hypothetical protein n=1 Tax=Duganella sp. CF458 TaxID=1884368 RepID=UPI0008E9AB3D|nr:hypothetical protein [Duganella sp. CF458]SFG85026.1 hypothetical protein SAMN05518865_12055 [Duganella sp. CF458]